MRWGAGAACLAFLAGCGAQPTPAGRQVDLTGTAESAPFRLEAGVYQAERRNLPEGCLETAGLFDRHGIAVIRLDRATPPSARGAWSGLSIDVIPGEYRVRGEAQPGCRWSLRLVYRVPIPSGTGG